MERLVADPKGQLEERIFAIEAAIAAILDALPAEISSAAGHAIYKSYSNKDFDGGAPNGKAEAALNILSHCSNRNFLTEPNRRR
jgi:hypothetical protein